MDQHVGDLLLSISSTCRRNWAVNGNRSVSIDTLKHVVLERVRERFGLEKDVTWSNYKERALNESAKREMEQIHASFDKNLEMLSKSKFIELKEEIVVETIPFDKLLEKVLSVRQLTIEQAVKEIQTFFVGDPEEMLEFLEYAGLITRGSNIIRSNVVIVEDLILDEVLTFIEERDAVQIKYGIYDTSMSGRDIFSGLRLPSDPFYVKLEYGLRTLMKERLLLPLQISPSILEWQFRSRIAEVVRLLHKLRQRFVEHHSYHDSPRLTRSVKLEITNRKFPRRYIQLPKSLGDIENQLRSSGSWNRYLDLWEKASLILIESLQKRGFENISDFQDRCFKKIFMHLVNSESNLRGFVISAGTGMGKTLSYIGPLLLYILLEKSMKGIKGTKAICVYPRIKLAENQIEGFVKSIYEINRRLEYEEPNITIGIDYTGTPYRRESFRSIPQNGKLFEGIDRLWEYDEKRDAYGCPYAKCPECGGSLYIKRQSDFSYKVPLKCLNEDCGASIDFVAYCKEDIAAEPPDIFITTTETLNRRLSSSMFQKLFGTEDYCTPKLIMIDEIHLHTSLRGSQIAYLVRRLLQRVFLGLQCSQQSFGEPIVLGLSATIGHAEEFFSELTGIPEHLVEVEGPTEEELEKSGVEYFIFVKPEIGEDVTVLSNLIQTCMCVLHNMPQPEDFPARNHKSLGFVDSLDLVRRWQHDIDDAETSADKRLYQLRDPYRIRTDARVRNYFGASNVNCSSCIQAPVTNCVHFREGECWWFMRFGSSQLNPLHVRYKTAGDGYVPVRYDLVVTTSAMEVGYDDPDIMCVIQYQSPMNIASFTQRKGRAGREIRNRPVSVAVLSPYRTKDVYYYRNHHILIEPSFEKLPLNVDNKAVKKIHGFYAILDFLAFNHRRDASDFPAYLDQNDIGELEDVLRRPKPVMRYLKKLFNYKVDDQELEDIWLLLKELIHRLDSIKLGRSTEPSEILDDYLPTNLFSSINLPTVDIYEYNVYDGDHEWQRSWISGCSQRPKSPDGFMEMLENFEKGRGCPSRILCPQKRNCRPQLLEDDVDVNLALAEASIANVTFRWGRTAFWIPPYNIEQDTPTLLKQMNIRNNWMTYQARRDGETFKVTSKLVPKTLRDMVPRIKNGAQPLLPVVRPEVIREVKFLTPDTDLSHWIYCFDHDTIYAGAKQFEDNHSGVTHRYDTITEKTTSYPFTFYDVDFRRDLLSEGYFKKMNLASDFEVGKIFGFYGNLFPEVYFANKDAGEYLKVRKAVIGSTCSITTRRARLERVFGYVDEDKEDIGLGYAMDTDGCDFWLQPHILKPELVRQKLPDVYNTLKHNFFKFEVLSANKRPGGRSSFSVNAFLNVYLTFITQTQRSLTSLKEYCSNDCKDKNLQKRFYKTLEEFFTLNSRTKREVMKLFGDSEFMNIVLTKHEEILEERSQNLIFNYIEDTFHHSIKHALKSAFVVLGGFESERDLGGWTYLNFDYDLPKHIYVFEHGMYGTGAFRSIYHKFKIDPQKIWNLVEDYLVSCPTGDEEHFLIEVLKLEDADLAKIAEMIETISKSTKFSDRKRSIHELTSIFGRNYSMELKEEDVRALTRIFTKPLELEGTTIENWKLFKELNIALYNYLKDKLGRDLTIEEVQEACFASLTGRINEPLMPTWKEFFEILKQRINSEYSLFLQKIRSDLSHIDGLKKYLEMVKMNELQKIYELSEEEQLEEVATRLGYNDQRLKETRKIVEILFAEIDDVPMFEYYYFVNAAVEFSTEAERKLRDSLTKRSLREEIEKRLLNTCIDACPSCLQTRCDIDFDLRSRLILSRRLLKHVVSELKENYTIDADRFSDFKSLKREVIERLGEKFHVYVKYSYNKSSMVAKLVSELLATSIPKEDRKYYVTVNSSGYQELSLKDRKVVYEIGLRCRETSL